MVRQSSLTSPHEASVAVLRTLEHAVLDGDVHDATAVFGSTLDAGADEADQLVGALDASVVEVVLVHQLALLGSDLPELLERLVLV